MKFVLYEEPLPIIMSQHHLGVILSSKLSWSSHVDHIISSAARLLSALKRLISQRALVLFYKTYIRPTLEYADIAWSNLSKCQADWLEHFQRKAARVLLKMPLFTPISHSWLLNRLQLPTLSSWQRYPLSLLAYTTILRSTPIHLLEVTFSQLEPSYLLRHSWTFSTPIFHYHRFWIPGPRSLRARLFFD